MSFSNKLLASGQLTNSSADVLTPSGKKLLIHNIIVFNITSGGVVLKSSIYNGSASLQFGEDTIASKKRVEYYYNAEGIVLESGHKLTLESDTATSVNYFIYGTEET
jgi:hypothetical protein